MNISNPIVALEVISNSFRVWFKSFYHRDFIPHSEHDIRICEAYMAGHADCSQIVMAELMDILDSRGRRAS